MGLRALSCFAVVVGAAGACSSTTIVAAPSDGGASSLADGATALANDGGPASSGDGPLRIVSLTSTAATIAGGDTKGTDATTVTFVAIVTDVDGLDAIAGGQLLDDAGHTFGAFGAGTNKSTFSASLDWKALGTAGALTFAAPGAKRAISAKFFDNAGRTAVATVDLGILCRSKYSIDGSPVAACAGECVDTRADAAHCGDDACGAPCPSDQACVAGKCSAFSTLPSCFSIRQIAPATPTCTAFCAAKGTGPCSGFQEGAACPVPTAMYDDCNSALINTPALGPFVHCVCAGS